MNQHNPSVEIYLSTEQLFEENVEYVPYEEDKEVISPNYVYGKLSDWMDKPNSQIVYDPIIEYLPESPECVETITTTPTKNIIPTDPGDQSILANVIQMYQCTICTFVTPLIEDFLKHHKTHLENLTPRENDKILEEKNQELFLCGQCSAVFTTMELCREHMIKDHKFEEVVNDDAPESDREENFINDYDDYDVELEEEDIEDDKESWMKPIPLRELKAKLLRKFIYKCCYKGCHYKFKTKEKRDKHIKCHASTDFLKVRDFKCYECGQEYNKWRDNTKHMWKAHKIDIDLLQCPLCDYRSLTSVLIFRHIQIHSSVKRFVCSVCSNVFSQASQLRSHLTEHLDKESKSPSKLRWYCEKICHICKYMFRNSKTLSKHIKAVHNKIKPFICSVCGFKSARKASLTFHMRQHTGDRPFKCKYCEFTARDPSCLKQHVASHEIIKPYNCKYCNYGASSQSKDLKRHMSVAHPEEYKATVSCDQCKFSSVNEETLKQHKLDHISGLIINGESSETMNSSPKCLARRQQISDKLNTSIEISIDSFLPLESTDSLNHDPLLDTGGVTIPATHSEDTQFPSFINS